MQGSQSAITAVKEAAEKLTKEELTEKLENAQVQMQDREFWEGDSWKRVVPGKRVLQAVADTLLRNSSAETLRKTIIALMSSDGFEPAGLRDTLEQALAYDGRGGEQKTADEHKRH